MTMFRPAEARFEVDGLFFKVGIHDKIFFWGGGEWWASSRTRQEVERQDRRQAAQGGAVDWD